MTEQELRELINSKINEVNESIVNEARDKASAYKKAGKLGYHDQFLGRRSLSYTLSIELGFDPKNEFIGGDGWIGFDHVSMYINGGKKEGTILDDALSGKYTYQELKDAAADFAGIKESVTEGRLTEATKPFDTRFVKEWEKMVAIVQGKMEEYKKNPTIKKDNILYGMANGAYNNMNTVKPIPGQWLKIDKMISEGLNVNEAKGWNAVAKVMDAALKKAKVSLSYAKDYAKSLEGMANRDAKQFFADYGDFTEDDFIEDVEYNMANESVTEKRTQNRLQLIFGDLN